MIRGNRSQEANGAQQPELLPQVWDTLEQLRQFEDYKKLPI